MQTKMSDLQDELSEARRQSQETIKIKEIESQAMVRHYSEKWRLEFDKRKKLHNLVAELKGNIRVLCRVRPYIDKETKEEGAPDPIKCLSEETLRVMSVDTKVRINSTPPVLLFPYLPLHAMSFAVLSSGLCPKRLSID